MLKSYIRIILISFVWLFYISLSSQIFADEPTLLEVIKSDEFLCAGNVEILLHKGSDYLVSVGRSTMENDKPESILKARKESELNAQEGLTKFIYDVQVSSTEQLETKTQVTTQDGKVIRRKIDESYIEIIREKSRGILKNFERIGKWKSKDGDLYFYAIGFLINS